MFNRHRKLSLIGASVVAAIAAAQSGAQEAQLEEIVVTARQRAERLEDVPATVQAFTATEIQAAGIERPQDFIALTPGVAQVQTAEAGDLQVTIRGINTGRDAETNFALVIDGVLQTNPNALNQELNNVSQIEVLKGPQGALYGRNAVAGAMIITTRKPSDSFEFDLGGGYGQYNSYKLNAYMGGPIGENTRASVSAYTRKTDGQWENVVNKCDDCVDFFEESGLSARLITDLEGGGTIDAKAKFSKLDAGAINFNASFALQEAAAGGFGALFYEDANKHNFIYLNNIIPENEQENINLSVKAEYPVAVGTLTAVAAFNDQTNYFLTDGTSAAFSLYSATASCTSSLAARTKDTPLPAPFFYPGLLPPYGPTTCDGYQYQQRDQMDTSYEVRLTSPGDQAFRWVAGAYFAEIERKVIVSQGSDNGTGFVKQGLIRTGGANPTDLLYDDDFDSTVLAGFGQLAYDIQDGLEVALALRYDQEKREVSNNVPKIGPQTPGFGGSGKFINPAYDANPALASIPGRSKTFSQLQPKLSVNWKATDGVALFASYGVGFRSGGFNSSGSRATIEQNFGGLCTGPTQWDKIGISTFLTVPACNANGSDRSLSNVRDDYEKEVSKAFEAGFKSTLLDGSLAVNGAVYQTKIDDLQFFNFFAGPFGLLRVVTNAEEAEVKGIEPEYTGNAGIDLKIPLGGSDWTMNARVNGTFIGETWFSTVQGNLVPNLFTYFGFGQGEFAKQKRDAFSTVDARVGVSNGTWGVTAWGRNITDESYLAEVIPAPEFGGSFIHDAPGSSWGVDFSYSFR